MKRVATAYVATLLTVTLSLLGERARNGETSCRA